MTIRQLRALVALKLYRLALAVAPKSATHPEEVDDADLGGEFDWDAEFTFGERPY